MASEVFNPALFRAHLKPRTPSANRANRANRTTRTSKTSRTSKDVRSEMAELKVKRETSVSDPAEVENRSETPP